MELFVAVLGASGFTYAEATATQRLPDGVRAHIHTVEYCGGATTLWVPDQLRSAVTRPCRYEPDVNRTYEDLAAHYGAVWRNAGQVRAVSSMNSRMIATHSSGCSNCRRCVASGRKS